jgi:hypothetical protein
MRRLLLCILVVCVSSLSFSQLKTPEAFLGYPPGEKLTPHWRVVEYFRHAAQNAQNIKLVEYGRTEEGRPLMIAIVSAPENMAELDRIRLNNLRLANIASDRAAAIEPGSPAIVWLSYNVHGNEASSTEASMLTLHTLLDPNDPASAWLKNTVVIIDPCINPDGRDRYVNWFNAVSGKKPDPKLVTREHREPWPGGRTNHYYFDLNRDWAWQSQIESKQRIDIYNQWMPQVHVDYHEQGVNDPYYFAPAAEPIHEVVTNWQREFQMTIGKNHARYFDKNGWFYFTREIFDLFYPSYGDTWPMFNGAIGMTYEQGGGPAGGLGAITESGDTLTLEDRVQHHYVTSLSTVEISSANAAKLVSSFRKYFNDAVSGANSQYKSYVIKNRGEDRQKLRALTEMLTRNGIEFGFASGNARGFNYDTRREENFQMQNDLVISAYQPRSAMVKVLFEPDAKLPDSLTYDITAWGLPYAYGLNAWASRERIQPSGRAWPAFVPNTPADSYAYVIRWEGLSSAKAVGALLQQGFRLRYSETPFEVDGKSFGRGSIIIMNRGESRLNQVSKLIEIANANGVTLHPVSTGFVDKGNDFGSERIVLMNAPRVYLLTGDGVNPYVSGEVWHFFEKQLEYPISLVNASDAARIDWSAVDVLILPPGNYSFLSDKNQAEAFRQWIRRGGRVIALQQAADALAKAELGLKLKGGLDSGVKNEKADYDALKRYSDRERDFIPGSTPGAVFRVELDNSHPLAFGYPDHYYTLKLDDKIYEFMKDGWNVGVIKKNAPVAGFVGAELKPKLKDGLVFGVMPEGRGTVTFFTDDILFRSFWESGKLMMANAVFLVK